MHRQTDKQTECINTFQLEKVLERDILQNSGRNKVDFLTIKKTIPKKTGISVKKEKKITLSPPSRVIKFTFSKIV